MWLPTSSGEPPKLESLSRLWPGIEGEYRSPSCRARLPRPWRDESPSTTLGWDAIGEAVYAQKSIQPRDQGTPEVRWSTCAYSAILLDSELLTHLSFSRFSSGSSAMGGLRCTEIRGRSIRCNRVGDAVLEAERSTPFFRSL